MSKVKIQHAMTSRMVTQYHRQATCPKAVVIGSCTDHHGLVSEDRHPTAEDVPVPNRKLPSYRPSCASFPLSALASRDTNSNVKLSTGTGGHSETAIPYLEPEALNLRTPRTIKDPNPQPLNLSTSQPKTHTRVVQDAMCL
jgi:hypothetical protein